MMDKYFGFRTASDEDVIIDSLIDHGRIDEEELYLLKQMVQNLCTNNLDDIESCHAKISKIRHDSGQGFEATESQIIQSHFDFQKQYDFLRIYHRIERISEAIIDCSERVVLSTRINSAVPDRCKDALQILMTHILEQHSTFQEALKAYKSNKSELISIIHTVFEQEKRIKKQYFICLESLYSAGNSGPIAIGNFRAIEQLIEHIESIGSTTESAATGLEWLLIN